MGYVRNLRGAGVLLCAALTVALTACAAPAPGPPAGTTSATTSATTAAAAGPLQFAGATVDGGRFDAATLAGTPVVLWFWAPF
jgi:hypothetical protein